MLSKARIAALIPHADSMCLLERVESSNETDIVCIATSHRDLAHPLRRGDRLPAICALEYAAQAMAAHGALLAGTREKPRVGLLASVRDLQVGVPSLETLPDLTIHACLLAGDAIRVSYRFSVRAESIPVMSGRATILLRPDQGRPQ